MPEPITTVGIGAIAAYLGKDGLEKLLGPTAEYLGSELKELAKKRIENVGKIFSNAEKKLGKKIEEPGEVSPRILKAVLDEGSFCDEEIATEYFGGILASSRTESGRDDRGVRLSKLVENLSTYQLRTHYIYYSTIRELYKNSNLRFDLAGRPKMDTYISYSKYIEAMGYDEKELEKHLPILNHTIHGMASENLIDPMDWRIGGPDTMVEVFDRATEAGITCQPSHIGAELFLWAFGHSDKRTEFIFDDEFEHSIPGIQDRFEMAKPTNRY